MNQPEPLDCQAVFRRLDDFVDRELTQDETALVQAHLDLCEVCAREYRFEASVIAAVRAKLTQVRAPQALIDRIRRSLEQDPGSA